MRGHDANLETSPAGLACELRESMITRHNAQLAEAMCGVLRIDRGEQGEIGTVLAFSGDDLSSREEFASEECELRIAPNDELVARASSLRERQDLLTPRRCRVIGRLVPPKEHVLEIDQNDLARDFFPLFRAWLAHAEVSDEGDCRLRAPPVGAVTWRCESPHDEEQPTRRLRQR